MNEQHDQEDVMEYKVIEMTVGERVLHTFDAQNDTIARVMALEYLDKSTYVYVREAALYVQTEKYLLTKKYELKGKEDDDD